MGYCTNCCCVYILFFRKIRFPCYTGDFQFYVIKPSITQKQINEIALFQYKLVNNTTDLIHIQIWLNWELLILLAPCHTLVPSSGEQANYFDMYHLLGYVSLLLLHLQSSFPLQYWQSGDISHWLYVLLHWLPSYVPFLCYFFLGKSLRNVVLHRHYLGFGIFLDSSSFCMKETHFFHFLPIHPESWNSFRPEEIQPCFTRREL